MTTANKLAIRRAILVSIGSGLLPSQTIVNAQPGIQRRMGVLLPFAETDQESKNQVNTFIEELRKLGWVADRNLRIDFRWASGGIDQIQEFAKELVSLNPDLLVGRSTPVVAALTKETRTIPILFLVVSDPVGDGFVKSLARPGGNVTGFINSESSMGGKWLELLKEISPRLNRVGVILNPKTSPGGGVFYRNMVEEAASILRLKAVVHAVQNAQDIEAAVESIGQVPNSGLVVLPDITTVRNRAVIIAAAARRRLPAIYAFNFIAKEGGLMAYGVDVVDIYRRGAAYAQRILKGDKPVDLPVQGPLTFELLVNRKVANTLGLKIPATILLRATEVIE